MNHFHNPIYSSRTLIIILVIKKTSWNSSEDDGYLSNFTICIIILPSSSCADETLREDWKVKSQTLSPVWLFATLWAACQAPLSMGFSRQEYCIVGKFFTIWTTREAPTYCQRKTPIHLYLKGVIFLLLKKIGNEGKIILFFQSKRNLILKL